jgi:hypothetical protein
VEFAKGYDPKASPGRFVIDRLDEAITKAK